MLRTIRQRLMKGTTLCVHFSVCVLISGTLQSADGRIHRKPDFAKYKANAASASVPHPPVILPWLQEDATPKEKKIVTYIKKGPLPWRAKNNKPQVKKPTEVATYVAPKVKPKLAKKPKAEVKKERVSIKQVVAERERVRTQSNLKSEDFGEGTQVVSNQELGNVRGGFVSAGGLVFDIGLFTQTILDGVVVDEISFDANDLINQNSAVNLQRSVNVSTTGVTVSNINLPDAAELITVIQNNVNDVVISNTTTLNIDVQNTATFIQQSQIPLINHQIVRSLN